MAKRAKATDGGEPTGVEAIRGNGFDPEKVKSFKQRIENLYGDMATAQSEYMTECKVIRGDIKEVLDEAKGEGIPKKEFKKVIEACRLANKIENIRNDLEGDEQDNYDLLMTAIGGLADLPLGQAAIAANGAAAHA